jgi:hypothetical protein
MQCSEIIIQLAWRLVERNTSDGGQVERQYLMKQSDLYRQNAQNCSQMAGAADAEPAFNRFKRMEAAWLALAEEQDWLDGEQSPAAKAKPEG